MKKILFIISIIGLSVLSTIKADAQVFKTSLTIIVRDDLGNTVQKASVKLFEKEEDYLKEQNPAAESISDDKGVAKFKKLKAIAYYVLVRKEDKDNAGGGEQTGKLDEGKFNKVTIVIQ